MKTNNNCHIECKQGKFKRLNPYNGMLLSDEDFLQEQKYFREKMKLHNRLHGYGVVCGLELLPNDPADFHIIVKLGMALDYNGNEIIVCQDQKIDLEQKITELFHVSSTDCSQLRADSGAKSLYIGIKYCEFEADPEAVYATNCDQEKRCEFSRVLEGFCVKEFTPDKFPWLPDNTLDNRKITICNIWEPYCPTREETEHYVLLGTITVSQQSSGITKEMITDYRKYIPSFPPSFHWSIPEKLLVSRIDIEKQCEAADWIDISSVINQKLGDAKEELAQEMNFTDVQQMQLNPEIIRLIFRRAADYLPFAKVTDTIHLIYDTYENENIVLFPIVNLEKYYDVRGLLTDDEKSSASSESTSSIKKKTTSKKRSGEKKEG